MDRYFDKLDDRGGHCPCGRQHQYTLYFFFGLSAYVPQGVISKVW